MSAPTLPPLTHDGEDCPLCDSFAEGAGAARDRKRAQERKLLDNRRSVFLIARLSTEPRRARKVTRRKRGGS